jgi:tRNA pseudouridine38-40 synthase
MVGASRTDSGAHALGQVCHFDSEVPIEPEKWVQAMNRILPLDVSVLKAEHVKPEFNCRFYANGRFYRYRFLLGDRNPLIMRFAHYHWTGLDLEAMQRSAKVLEGVHDFRGYTEELDPSVENTVRNLRTVRLKAAGNEIWLEVVGTAFLRGMMRRMAGALFEVGRGIRAEGDTARLLTSQWREMHLPVVLPARGLTLMAVRYGRNPQDCRRNPPDSSVDNDL